DRGDTDEQTAIAPERLELVLDLPPEPVLLRKESDETRAHPPAEDERDAAADEERRERPREPVSGEREERDGTEGHEDREPARAIEEDAVRGQARTAPLAEVERADHVSSDGARPEDVEEHADEVEAQVVPEPLPEADGASEERPLAGAQDLPDEIESERTGDEPESDAR